MKYFGEFLIKKGVVTSQSLVEAFLDQLMHLPPLPKLIYEQNLLNSDQMLQAFTIQQESEVDFASACKKLGFWTAEFDATIEHIYAERRIPFGRFLIQNGVVDTKILIKTLDEFLNQVEVPAQTQNLVTSSKVEALPSNQAKLSFKAGILDSLAKEVCEFFTATKKDELKNILTLVRQNLTVKELSGDFLQDILKNIHTLKGVARFGKTEIVDYVSNSVEELLTSYLKSSHFGENEIGEQVCSYVSKAINLLWELRNSIELNKSESGFWNNIDNRNKLDAWVSEVLNLNHFLRGVSNEAQSVMR